MQDATDVLGCLPGLAAQRYKDMLRRRRCFSSGDSVVVVPGCADVRTSVRGVAVVLSSDLHALHLVDSVDPQSSRSRITVRVLVNRIA